MIYLDYASSSPVDEDVLNLYFAISERYFANPNSNHKMGKFSKEIIDKSTERISKLLNVKEDEIIYTSGATESNNLSIKGIAHKYQDKGKHIIISALEHNSIIASASELVNEGFDVDIVPVNKEGIIDIDELKKMIRKDTILVSICAVDSEIGLRQPIEEIGKLLKEYPNVHFHSDASQAMGKADIDYSDVDLVTIAPHKFGGLNGIGILIKKEGTELRPIINGGRSTTIYRSGTPDTAAITALSLALEKALTNKEKRYDYVKNIYDSIINDFKTNKLIHINNKENSIPYTINISVKGIRSDDMVKLLEEKDVYVSTKTSCCVANSPSKLVYALTNDNKLATTSIRISLSYLVQKQEVTNFLNIINEVIKENVDEKKSN